MDPAIQNLVDISQTPAALNAKADVMLERARWASQVFQRYDREKTLAIAMATAEAAQAKAGEYGEWAVRETGFGVAGTGQNERATFSAMIFTFPTDSFGVGTGDGFTTSA